MQSKFWHSQSALYHLVLLKYNAIWGLSECSIIWNAFKSTMSPSFFLSKYLWYHCAILSQDSSITVTCHENLFMMALETGHTYILSGLSHTGSNSRYGSKHRRQVTVWAEWQMHTTNICTCTLATHTHSSSACTVPYIWQSLEMQEQIVRMASSSESFD